MIIFWRELLGLWVRNGGINNRNKTEYQIKFRVLGVSNCQSQFLNDTDALKIKIQQALFQLLKVVRSHVQVFLSPYLPINLPHSSHKCSAKLKKHRNFKMQIRSVFVIS